MYALMAFGAAAVMILFIAVIIAGTIVGTVMALLHVVQWARGTQAAPSIPSRSEQISTDALA